MRSGRDPTKRSGGPAPVSKPSRKRALAPPERAELQRQGAKAAARGDEASSNPMHATPNMPTATGESSETWGLRRDAWQQGYQAQSAPAEDEQDESGPRGDAAAPER